MYTRRISGGGVGPSSFTTGTWVYFVYPGQVNNRDHLYL